MFLSSFALGQGRSDGGYMIYRDIYPPLPQNQSTLIFLCGYFVSLQCLVNIYTHPSQIPGYASALGALAPPRPPLATPLE